MRKKNDLFELIQAMSRSEKRYFTMDASKGDRKDSRYLKLFKAINQQDVYAEAVLKKAFGRRLADDKARLYEAILRSMRDYRSSKSHLARIKELILDGKFLYERGLYQQSQERLRAAKALAQDLGDRLTLLELNKEERRLWKYLRPAGYADELVALMQEMDQYSTQLIDEFTYLDHHDRLLIESNQTPKLTDAQRDDLARRYAFLLDSTQSVPHSVQGKLRYFQCLVFLYTLLGQPDKVYEYARQVVDVWNDHPLYKEEDFYSYILHASNLLHAAFTNPDKFHHLPTLLHQLESERPHSIHDQQVLFQKVANYRLVYHINSGDFRDLDRVLTPIGEGLAKYRLNPVTRLMIQTNMAMLYFAAAQYDDCVARCEVILQESRQHASRQDAQEGIRLLRLMSVYELDNPILFEGAIRAASRYFRQQETSAFQPFVSFCLQVFRKLLQAPARETKAIFRTTRDALQHRADLRKSPLGLNELMTYWCESKVTTHRVADFFSGKVQVTRSQTG